MTKQAKTPAKATAKAAPSAAKAENKAKDVTSATAEVTSAPSAPAQALAQDNTPEQLEQKDTGTKTTVTAAAPFYDIAAKTTRKVGVKFSVSKQRADELRAKSLIK